MMIQDTTTTFVPVAGKQPGRVTMIDKFAQAASCLYDLFGQIVNLKIALIVDDETMRCVKNANALRDIAKDHVELSAASRQ